MRKFTTALLTYAFVLPCLPAISIADNSWILYVSSSSYDFDGDGLNRSREKSLGTNWQAADTDGDGLTDGNELVLLTNPLLVDSDGDGLTDSEEIALGTNALMVDTDGDTVSDSVEVAEGLNPLDFSDCRKWICGSGILKIVLYSRSK